MPRGGLLSGASGEGPCHSGKRSGGRGGSLCQGARAVLVRREGRRPEVPGPAQIFNETGTACSALFPLSPSFYFRIPTTFRSNAPPPPTGLEAPGDENVVVDGGPVLGLLCYDQNRCSHGRRPHGGKDHVGVGPRGRHLAGPGS